MSVDTYEELDDQLTDILSSGGPFEMSTWHKESLRELFEGFDRDSLISQLNLWYAGQTVGELREGELEVVAELVNELDPKAKKVNAESTIIFK